MDASCPAISVVIPSYNYGHLLPRALDSVLHQLSENDALIVIDDGSTDDTAQCLAEYTARHPGLSAVRQENAGAAAARNHGIRLAKTPMSCCWMPTTNSCRMRWTHCAQSPPEPLEPA